MPDVDGDKKAKDFGIGVPQETPGFHVKGSGAYELSKGVADASCDVFI